jgi:colanic acid/amylovoran biosynthesis glycosyltransferase
LPAGIISLKRHAMIGADEMDKAGPPKIAYVLAEYPSQTETFIVNEIRGLEAAGAHLTILALREGKGKAAAECPVFYRGRNTEALPRPSMREALKVVDEALALNQWSPAALACALRNAPTALEFIARVRKADITHLHSHFAYTATDLALMVARVTGASASFSAHAWDAYCASETFARKLRRARLCITCNEAAEKHLRTLVDEPLQERITCIYHGTDLSRFVFAPRSEPNATPRILAVGRFVEKKGFETLIYACRRLRAEVRFECEIVGDGVLGRDLRRLADELGVSDIVRFTPMREHSEMPRLYASADVLAVPSVVARNGDRDGLPNVVVEAMACGLPVVASAVGGIAEAVNDEQTGLIVPPGDSAALARALRRMLAETELRFRCIQNARSLVEEKFDAKRNSSRVYEAILKAATA